MNDPMRELIRAAEALDSFLRDSDNDDLRCWQVCDVPEAVAMRKALGNLAAAKAAPAPRTRKRLTYDDDDDRYRAAPAPRGDAVHELEGVTDYLMGFDDEVASVIWRRDVVNYINKRISYVRDGKCPNCGDTLDRDGRCRRCGHGPKIGSLRAVLRTLLPTLTN